MYINRIAYQLGVNKVSIDKLLSIHNISQQQGQIFNKYYDLHTVYRDSKSYSTLCGEIIDKLQADIDLTRINIKIIIFTHTANPISTTNSLLTHLIQKKVESSGLIFGSSLYRCAGGVIALKCLHDYLCKQIDRSYALLLTADKVFCSVFSYIPNSSFCSDGGALVLLDNFSGSHRFIDMLYACYPQYWQGIWDSDDNQQLFTENYSSYLIQLIEKILKQNALDIDSIRYILPHNVNLISWQKLSRQLKFPLKKIYLANIPQFAHCFGADPFINLACVLQQQGLKPGDYYLLISVGLGATFAVALYQY